MAIEFQNITKFVRSISKTKKLGGISDIMAMAKMVINIMATCKMAFIFITSRLHLSNVFRDYFSKRIVEI